MSIQWVLVNDELLTATFYDTNITLNKASSSYFEDAYYVIFGVDVKNKIVIIKHLNKTEAGRGNIDKNSLLRINIRPSYGRISSKRLMKELEKVFDLDYQKHNKYKAEWDFAEKTLKIILDEVVK